MCLQALQVRARGYFLPSPSNAAEDCLGFLEGGTHLYDDEGNLDLTNSTIKSFDMSTDLMVIDLDGNFYTYCNIYAASNTPSGSNFVKTIYDGQNDKIIATTLEGNLDWNYLTSKPTFSTVATSGAYSDLSGTPTLATVATSGAYSDLTGTPTLATVATSGAYSNLSGTPTLATVATSGAYSDLTGTPTLATVATSGAYSDLTGTPTLATVATSGAYSDLTASSTASLDAVSSWATRTSTANQSWSSICYVSELPIYVAVSQSASVMTSTDSFQWTAVSASNSDWRSVCYGNGRFCAVGTSSIMTSDTGGLTWTTRTSPAGGWMSVCFAPELTLFCAVAMSGTSGARAMTSSTGISWTTRSTPTTTPNQDWRCVCWAPELGLFVASGTNSIMTSPDGINWTGRTSTTGLWQSIAWSYKLGLLCAVASSGTGTSLVQTSPNGVNWTSRTSPTTAQWLSVAWSQQLSLFCAVGAYSTANNFIMISYNGVDWTQISIGLTTQTTNNWNSVCWSPEHSIFVAVSSTGTNNRVMASSIALPNYYNVVKALPSQMTVKTNGRVGIGYTNPNYTLDLNTGTARIASMSMYNDIYGNFWLTSTMSAAGNTIINGDYTDVYGSRYGGSLQLRNSTTGNAWSIRAPREDQTDKRLEFIWSVYSRGYLVNNVDVANIDFTGQHRSYSHSKLDRSHAGLIVVSTGAYKNLSGSNIDINEALPIVDLCSTSRCGRVYGVISDKEEGTEREYRTGAFVSVIQKEDSPDYLIINSLGEGGIWVCDTNGNFQNGDYITSSDILGYGMRQDDDLLHNYTVAKITCDCDFGNLPDWIQTRTVIQDGQEYVAAFVGCTYHCG